MRLKGLRTWRQRWLKLHGSTAEDLKCIPISIRCRYFIAFLCISLHFIASLVCAKTWTEKLDEAGL